MPIQWFPGHMARARRVLAENLRLCDIVIEIRDARLPYSSSNPEINRLLGDKPRVIVLNKNDLADPVITEEWKVFYAEKNIPVIFTDCRSGSGVKEVVKAINDKMQPYIQKCIAKGRKKPVIKAMAVGIPNVGKSSFINKITGRAGAKTGDKPGVTRNIQWLNINPDIMLLDMPGLLWPKFEDQNCAYKLAASGAIKDDISDVTEIACYLCLLLAKRYREAFFGRYGIDLDESFFEKYDDEYLGCLYTHIADGVPILETVGRKRGCLIKGGEVDLTRASNILLDEFRGGKIGRISLDFTEDEK